MKINILILTAALIVIPNTVQAEDFMLPQSFSIDRDPPPAIEQHQQKSKVDKDEENKISSDSNVPSEKIKKESFPGSFKPVKTDISLAELIENFNYEYHKTLRSTMATLTQLKIKPMSYDSSKGQIRAELNSGKEIFILLLPSQEKLTHVRITPADGRYNISRELVSDIFRDIKRNLYSDIN